MTVTGELINLAVTDDKETKLYPSGSNTAQGQLSVIKKREK